MTVSFGYYNHIAWLEAIDHKRGRVRSTVKILTLLELLNVTIYEDDY